MAAAKKPVVHKPGEPESVADLSDEFLMCRDLRHAWEIVGFFRERTRASVYNTTASRVLRCVRCSMRRIDDLSSGWSDKRTTYMAPENYYIHGEGRATMAEIRYEESKRFKVEQVSIDKFEALLED